MAFTWTVKIIPIDIPKKIISVNCMVVDTVDNNKEYSVSVANADISTAAKKTATLNVLWNKFVVKYQHEQLLKSIATEIATLEAAAKTNLEGRTI